jgi:hypothetical protein
MSPCTDLHLKVKEAETTLLDVIKAVFQSRNTEVLSQNFDQINALSNNEISVRCASDNRAVGRNKTA